MNQKNQNKIVWIVSDGTGRTATQLVKAASYQFENAHIEYRTIIDVTTEKQIEEIVERVKRESGMIVYTIVSKLHRRFLHRLSVENHIMSVDLFGPIVATLQKFLQKVPLEQPGLTQKINQNYYRMVDALDFSICHDDGKALESVDEADIVIIGPSRVGKTPLSVYLAYMGWKVANIPVIANSNPTKSLNLIPFKVFCLIIDPTFLQKRRIDRIKKLGDPKISGYTDLKSINEEIEYCREISQDGKKWPLIDVTYKPIEDIAKEIIQLVSL
jgi:regulator of PEP synthase PpsR (kinase-PPPase family)